MAEPEAPDFELVEGLAGFARRMRELAAGAHNELALLSQDLDRRVYGTDEFVGTLRSFVLQNRFARLRVLVSNPQTAIRNNPRLVEFGRTLSTFVEFRELLPERQQVIFEEYLVADGRKMLVREAPGDLESRYYTTAPHLARLKLKDFDMLWNESVPAQELRSLRL